MNRVHLPTHEDLGLAPVALLRNPAEYNVQPPLAGESDDVLRHRAESGEWDLYETHEIDAPIVSLRALRNRFDGTYSGDPMDEPGNFVKAVWDMQRQIPDTSEFAARLAQRGVITTEEAALASTQRSQSDKDLSDTEFDALRTYHKLFYAANVRPDSQMTDTEVKNVAGSYASDVMSVKQFNDKPALRAHERLYAARGLEAKEISSDIDALRAGRPSGVSTLRRLGLSPAQAEQIADAPLPPFLSPYYEAAQDRILHGLGTSELDGQIAVRQFFGPENLVKLLVNQVAFERAIRAAGVQFSEDFIADALTGSRLVSVNTSLGKPHTSKFASAELAEDSGLGEKLAELGSLATFAMREPTLRGMVEYHAKNMTMYDYRVWLDQRIAAEATANV